MNCIIQIAQGKREKEANELKSDSIEQFITPEDVSSAFLVNRVDEVRTDLLSILSRCEGYTVREPSLCCYIAWKGHEVKGEELAYLRRQSFDKGFNYSNFTI